jgi:hypothetical protein
VPSIGELASAIFVGVFVLGFVSMSIAFFVKLVQGGRQRRVLQYTDALRVRYVSLCP